MSRHYPDRSPAARAARYERIVAMARRGCTVPEIMDAVGVGASTVVAARKAAGLSKPRPPRYTDTELEQAEQLLADGAPYAEVARTLGRSRQALARRFPGRGMPQAERDDLTRARRRLEGGRQAGQIEAMWAHMTRPETRAS